MVVVVVVVVVGDDDDDTCLSSHKNIRRSSFLYHTVANQMTHRLQHST